MLEISKISDASNSQNQTKTSAKDIAIQETVKTLKNHSASQSQLNASSESDRRWAGIILMSIYSSLLKYFKQAIEENNPPVPQVWIPYQVW